MVRSLDAAGVAEAIARSTMAAPCALNDYPAVIELLDSALSVLGPQLFAFEVVWPDYWNLIRTSTLLRTPVGAGHGLYVLVEAQGTDEGIDAPRFQSWLELVQNFRLTRRSRPSPDCVVTSHGNK